MSDASIIVRHCSFDLSSDLNARSNVKISNAFDSKIDASSVIFYNRNE